MDEEGVSEIVGTVIVLGLVIVLFSVLSLTALSLLEASDDTVRADLHPLQRDNLVLIAHQGGDSVPLSAELLVRTASGVTQVPISTLVGDWTDAGTSQWMVGQSLCISCTYDVSLVEAYALVYGNEFLLEVDLDA